MVETLRHEPTAVRFQRIGDQAKRLAARLRKDDLDIVIQANGVRLPSDRWADLWSSAVHLLRNALDHGIESAEERLAAGKPAHGTLTFRSRIDGSRFVIEFSDDGRGIDWQRVAEKAKKLELSTTTREDLVKALLLDGFSTRDSADALSGRGVGMSAVRQAVEALGGSIQVISSPGKGTTWRLSIPVSGNDRPSPHSARPGARPSLRPLSPGPRRRAAV
jgi:two-component system chemotaxis sensor kinase CheA